jgi:hypothetical protein
MMGERRSMWISGRYEAGRSMFCTSATLAATAATLLVATPAVAAGPALPPRPADMEIDSDAPKPEPKEPAPLPPAEPGAWGVGGTEAEGRFAPQSKKVEDDEDHGPIDLGPQTRVALDAVMGFGSVETVDSGTPFSPKVTVASLVPEVVHRVGDMIAVGARFPLTRASVQNTSASETKTSTFAVGNVALDLRPTFALSSKLKFPTLATLYLPTAQGDHFAEKTDTVSHYQEKVNLSAAASRGWEETALFAPKRFGIALGGGVQYDFGGASKSAHATASTKLEIMKKGSGSDAPAGSPDELHATTTDWVTTASFAYDFLDGKVTPGLRAWLTVVQPAVDANNARLGGAQFVFEPGVASRYPLAPTSTLVGRLAYIAPVGGPLGGRDGASIGGLRLQAEIDFQ